MWEQEHIADRRRIRQQHHQPVDADALADRRRHAVLEGADVIGVVVHGLQVARVLLRHLLAEALGLVLGVVELAEAVGELAAGDEELEAVRDKRVASLRRARGDTSVG
jgi:hypothetical protein